jgi:hypothetical protein
MTVTSDQWLLVQTLIPARPKCVISAWGSDLH